MIRALIVLLFLGSCSTPAYAGKKQESCAETVAVVEYGLSIYKVCGQCFAVAIVASGNPYGRSIAMAPAKCY